jgi:hypothetical protein
MSWVKTHRALTVTIGVILVLLAVIVVLLLPRPQTPTAAPSPSKSASASPSKAKPSAPPAAVSEGTGLQEYPSTKMYASTRDTSPVSATEQAAAVAAVKAYYDCDGSQPRDSGSDAAAAFQNDFGGNVKGDPDLSYHPGDLARAWADTACQAALTNDPSLGNVARTLTEAHYDSRWAAQNMSDILQIDVTYDETDTVADGTKTLKGQQSAVFVWVKHQDPVGRVWALKPMEAMGF